MVRTAPTGRRRPPSGGATGRPGSPTCTGSASTPTASTKPRSPSASPAVALDLPGHGRSSWRDDADYGASVTAPTVLAALDALEVPPGIVVGHSLGAILSARLAATAPERVTGLVLVDMSPDFAQRAVDRIARALEAEEPFATLDQVVDRAIEARVGDDRHVLLREARHTTRLGDDGALVRRHRFPHLPAGRTSSVGASPTPGPTSRPCAYRSCSSAATAGTSRRSCTPRSPSGCRTPRS
ncbi:alpha/beta fold hydrolase [Sphingomonas sp. LR61]|uniref:alpha/beta fold hydrolase n=1 Tax=Sphingomonas sp. LR61 TaxID=3050234 RepID=UPI002FE30689